VQFSADIGTMTALILAALIDEFGTGLYVSLGCAKDRVCTAT
jgi:hypothetical protein